MSIYGINDQANENSQSYNDAPKKYKKMSREMVIELGINALQEIGSEHICKVCIAKGGSCCNGCRHLVNGIGCQLRNTSCTAWLCGFQKYLLYETGLLQEWNDFWIQVPGQDYREDFTPEFFIVEKSLHVQDIKNLSKALAADLKELEQAHIAVGFILTLREKLDKNIDQLDLYKDDPNKRSRLRKNIKNLSGPFQHFHQELLIYKQNNLVTGGLAKGKK